MKKFELNLSEYAVEVNGEHLLYPLRANISAWLRAAGVFRSANDIAEAVSLARAVRECKDGKLVLDETEARILRTAVDRIIEMTAEGKGNLGGELHEEAICRIAKMKEVE